MSVETAAEWHRLRPPMAGETAHDLDARFPGFLTFLDAIDSHLHSPPGAEMQDWADEWIDIYIDTGGSWNDALVFRLASNFVEGLC